MIALLLLVALALGLAVAGAITFIVLCLGIRREDRSERLDGQAAGQAARLARRFTGLRTEQPGMAGPPSRRRATDRAGVDA